MAYHFLAWYEALRPYGVRVSCFDIYSREGERWDKSLKELFGRSGIKAGKQLLKEVSRRRARIFNKYFRRFIFPGARDFLVCLKAKGYLLGLATGTPTAQIRKILPADIRSLFDCVIAGDMVSRGKPDPQPYLRAAAGLGVLPGSCVVVENAPLGIESAHKAGMFCVALTTSLPREYLRRADAVVDRLEEITGMTGPGCRTGTFKIGLKKRGFGVK